MILSRLLTFNVCNNYKYVEMRRRRRSLQVVPEAVQLVDEVVYVHLGDRLVRYDAAEEVG